MEKFLENKIVISESFQETLFLNDSYLLQYNTKSVHVVNILDCLQRKLVLLAGRQKVLS